MTDLDALAIGSTCASRDVTVDGAPQTFGMVVDLGIYEDTGEPYADLLVEVPRREVAVDVKHGGAAKPKAVGVARIHRIGLAELDPGSVEEPRVSRMEGWARKALVGEAVLPGHTFLLAFTAARLMEEAEAVTKRLHTATQVGVDAFNQELEERRAEREGLAS